MARFPIVKSLSAPNVRIEDTIGEIRIDGQIAGQLIAEKKAGRPVLLQIEIEERTDGIHIIAAELIPTPVPIDKEIGKGEKFPEAGQVPTTDAAGILVPPVAPPAGDIPGSGSGSGTGSGDGSGSGAV